MDEAKAKQAELLLLFVRHVAVPTIGPTHIAHGNSDQEAVALFDQATKEAGAAGVKLYCLYSVAYDVPEAILEIAVTHGIDTLILGTSQRGALWHVMKGDVIQQVAKYLPAPISLLIHA